MPDPTAADLLVPVLRQVWWPPPLSPRLVAVEACEALGVDPDCPKSLLDWHAAVTARERLARQVEDLVPDLSADPHTAGYAAACLDIIAIARGGTT